MGDGCELGVGWQGPRGQIDSADGPSPFPDLDGGGIADGKKLESGHQILLRLGESNKTESRSTTSEFWSHPGSSHVPCLS